MVFSRWQRRAGRSNHSNSPILPYTEKPRNIPFFLGPCWRRRHRTTLVLFCCSFAFFTYFCAYYTPLWRTYTYQRLFGPHPLPPLYQEYHKQELMLPQHATKTPFANGQKYIWIPSPVDWPGWGNYMQDVILTAHLVYMTGRTFVFDDYAWDKGPAYTIYHDRLIPTRIPLTTVFSGPLVGGSFPAGDPTPRAIHKSHYDSICRWKSRVVKKEDVQAIHGPDATAAQVLDTWVHYLENITDPCVEITRDDKDWFRHWLLELGFFRLSSKGIFHVFMFGDKHKMLPIWPTLSKSPIMTHFSWSPLLQSALDANRAKFAPEHHSSSLSSPVKCVHCGPSEAPLEGLLVLHLRRGDFMEHCVNLCHWGSGFHAFNEFPQFLDQWEPPQGDEEHRMRVYLQRCLPTIDQIVEEIEAVGQTQVGQGLQSIYMMTNGDDEWLATLKLALRARHTWTKIATSRDMVFTPEQDYVSQAMDMLIGQRAQVFIGNGFSSFTSNVAMLRMGKGLPAESTRMW